MVARDFIAVMVELGSRGYVGGRITARRSSGAEDGIAVRDDDGRVVAAATIDHATYSADAAATADERRNRDGAELIRQAIAGTLARLPSVVAVRFGNHGRSFRIEADFGDGFRLLGKIGDGGIEVADVSEHLDRRPRDRP